MFTDTGAGGVFGRSARAEVSNCIVRGFGRIFPSAPGIAVTGQAMRVHHNDISDGLFNGIAFQTKDDAAAAAVVDFNVVHNNGHETDDGICDFGGIHFGGSGATVPYFIQDNVFANITAFQNGGEGIYADVLCFYADAMCLYVDAMSSYVDVMCNETTLFDSDAFVAKVTPVVSALCLACCAVRFLVYFCNVGDRVS